MPKFDRVTVHYFSDGNSAYWTETFDDGPPCAFSANRYATFHGFETSEGRQALGPHSTPVGASDPRRYFLARPGFAGRLEFYNVEAVTDLPK